MGAENLRFRVGLPHCASVRGLRVELWVPELGGKFDARNPSHKMLMSVLGVDSAHASTSRCHMTEHARSQEHALSRRRA